MRVNLVPASFTKIISNQDYMLMNTPTKITFASMSRRIWMDWEQAHKMSNTLKMNSQFHTLSQFNREVLESKNWVKPFRVVKNFHSTTMLSFNQAPISKKPLSYRDKTNIYNITFRKTSKAGRQVITELSHTPKTTRCNYRAGTIW